MHRGNVTVNSVVASTNECEVEMAKVPYDDVFSVVDQLEFST